MVVFGKITRFVTLYDHTTMQLLADQGYLIEKCPTIPYKKPKTPQEFAFNNLLKWEKIL